MSSTVVDIPTAPVFEPLLYPARYKGCHGGRGSGKSHFFADLLIERCMLQPTHAVCLREIQRTLSQSVKRLLEIKIEQLGLVKHFIIKKNEIETPHRGRIIFQGMQDHTADSIKSLEGYDVAWFEEAHTCTDRSLSLLRPTIRKPGSEIWFSWNPENKSNPVDQFFRGGTPPPDSVCIEANFTDNPWFPDVLRLEMEYDRRRDPERYQHVWMGGYSESSESRVFKNWRVDEFECRPGTVFRFGADWGFSVDPSVLVRASLDGHLLRIDYEAWQIGCEIDQLPDLFDSVPESRRWYITADSARPETISYMQRHGYPKIRSAIKGKKSVEEGVEFLKSFDIVVHPRCIHTIEELTNYRYKKDPATGDILPILQDKDNHVIDALRYACEGVRNASGNNKNFLKPLNINRKFVV